MLCRQGVRCFGPMDKVQGQCLDGVSTIFRRRMASDRARGIRPQRLTAWLIDRGPASGLVFRRPGVMCRGTQADRQTIPQKEVKVSLRTRAGDFF